MLSKIPKPTLTNLARSPYFCPKRFNRFPRFSIFLRRLDREANNKYIAENTVSLSPEFLSILMENKEGLLEPFKKSDKKGP